MDHYNRTSDTHRGTEINLVTKLFIILVKLLVILANTS
jgi:hypothetical protein